MRMSISSIVAVLASLALAVSLASRPSAAQDPPAPPPAPAGPATARLVMVMSPCVIEFDTTALAGSADPVTRRVTEMMETVSGTQVPVGRAKVPGGWLLAIDKSFTFVPDPEHTWNGSSLPR